MNNRKTVIVTLLLVFLLVGGAGGYLLWRVNQKETVAPVDSDAGLLEPGEDEKCAGGSITVTFSELESKEGSLQVTTSLSKVKKDSGSNHITQTFTNSCDKVDTIKAVPKPGYSFAFWHDVKRGKKNSSQEITVKYSDFEGVDQPTLRAVYEPGFLVSYTPVCQGYTGDLGTLLTCSDPAGGRVSGDRTCFNQRIGRGEVGKPVYIVKRTGEECIFKRWESEKGEDLGNKDLHVAEKVEADLKIKAVFEKVYTGSNFSLKYSSKGEGSLKVDGKEVKAYPVTVQYISGKPYPHVPKIEAVAKQGWVFDRWESNISGSSLSDPATNPRHDVAVEKDLDIIAIYKQRGGSDPVKPDIPQPPKPPEKPVNDGTDDKMPQTSAFSDRSLYIITVGALVLSLGMVWQYVPKDIFNRFVKKK